MAKMTLSDGTVIITIDYCKCGLTAGCELCRPYTYKDVPTYPFTGKEDQTRVVR
jgi:hypothetical protein